MPTTKGKTKKGKMEFNLEEMAEAGLHLGHKTSKIHPKMKPYIYGVRSTIHIIDLEKTAKKMEEALKFVSDLLSEKKTLLIVGTKVQARKSIKELAGKYDLPYVVERWPGGLFTNFKSIKKRVEHLKDLEEKKKKGEFEKYTKKEQIELDREIDRLETKFGGIKNLEGLPEAIFVLDMKKDNLAIREAVKKGVKVVAVADTNVDPSQADYVIPASDDALSSIQYILSQLEKVLKKK